MHSVTVLPAYIHMYTWGKDIDGFIGRIDQGDISINGVLW